MSLSPQPIGSPLTAAAPAARAHAPLFTRGSTMRHVVVMTATGSIGLVAVFAVDFLSLFWVSRLGVQSLKAAVGYASQLQFLAFSVTIGFTIAISATVSRALGAGDRARARRLAASGLSIAGLASAAVAAAMFVFRDSLLATLMHAHGEPAAVASRFLAITIPANVPLALGMGLSGVLRAAGDARGAMFVTLSGALITAAADPALIFGLGLGVYGAAWTTVIARLVVLGFGVYAAIHVHNLVGRPRARDARGDVAPIMAIGVPSIMANLATPVAAVYVTRVWSDFGEAAVAGGAIVDRVGPLAFGVIFALTGSIGPIIGQNFGAKLMDRVRRAITDSLLLAVGYALMAWASLGLAAPWIITAFDAHAGSADFVAFFCRFGAAAWVFLTCLFVANTVFNNLGFPLLAMIFNWGRATLGTMPFVALGARYGGVEGAMLGAAAGAAAFGLAGVAVAYGVTARLANAMKTR
jgi:putative MATE family efflux protein